MSDTTRNRRTRFWFDPRFSIGLGLVVCAVVGVVAVVAQADSTITVLAARETLAVGDRITPGDLDSVQVRLGGTTELYLTPGIVPEEGLLVTRTIAEGELVPASAVGTRSGADVTRLVAPLSGALAASIGAGSVVDVWSAKHDDRGQFGPPAVLVDQASIVRIVPATGFLASDGAVNVELLVPRDAVPVMLEAIANGDALAVVPVNAGLER
ncbi:hypothetical protein [Glaciibacter psychrotolerans]|uniref:SAF domain-containing protein n=1 Tax=Glaciibacter psychrotolerans TaxID=670054 RepID=A0A7Z0EEU9_9MICO|nr:hypothetical protein [Leifsonia psychrotolerans]NYJ20203.1 hypothetical protein [Leifsonia psychrotolerans]